MSKLILIRKESLLIHYSNYFIGVQTLSHLKSSNDINELVKELIAQVVENSLEGELDELGYTKYDHKNKETDNSLNGYSKKTVHSSFGDIELDLPRDRKSEFEPQLIQKNQNTLTQVIEPDNHLDVCEGNVNLQYRAKCQGPLLA
jgi:hypothetical protein